MLFAVAPDLELQHAGERIDHRHTDAVQAARHLVGVVVLALAELAARMQLRHHHLGGRDALPLVDAGRDAATVVAHGARAVRVERDDHLAGEARQRLVDGVVDNLVDHVVQAGAVVGVADVHSGALAHGIQALQDLDGFSPVMLGAIGLFGGLCAHARDVLFGEFLQLRTIHQDGSKSTQNAASEGAKNTLFFSQL
jgi:hypothetical protein